MKTLSLLQQRTRALMRSKEVQQHEMPMENVLVLLEKELLADLEARKNTLKAKRRRSDSNERLKSRPDSFALEARSV